MPSNYQTFSQILRKVYDLASTSIRVKIVSGSSSGSGTQASFATGATSSIGATEKQLVVASTPALVGVLIRADKSNTSDVFVGNTGLTAGTVDATDGLPLSPGEPITIEIDDANKIYLRSTSSGQKVYWVVV